MGLDLMGLGPKGLSPPQRTNESIDQTPVKFASKATTTTIYRGARYSFGYPACPKVSDSNIQLSLLDTKRINLTMDESEQLHPEQSTTAIISLHSKAKYFSA